MSFARESALMILHSCTYVRHPVTLHKRNIPRVKFQDISYSNGCITIKESVLCLGGLNNYYLPC
jgi:hypothetical protein